MRQFVNLSMSPFLLSLLFLEFIGLLTINHLKNNSKKFVETFGQLEKKLYFCTRFRKGSRFIKIDKIFFQKSFGSSEKVVILHPLSKRE